MLPREDTVIYNALKTMLTVQFCFAHYSIVLCPPFLRIMPIICLCCAQSIIFRLARICKPFFPLDVLQMI